MRQQQRFGGLRAKSVPYFEMMKNKQLSSSLEQTIHAVPSGEYMSPPQLEFFRQRLEDERRRLLQNVQGTLEQMQGIISEPDPNDRASTEENFA